MDNNDDTKTYYKTYKYSFSFAFKQQLLKAWQPKPTLKCAIIIYLILGIIFLRKPGSFQFTFAPLVKSLS